GTRPGGGLTAPAGRAPARLQDLDPDFVVIEIADGILQRETAMLLADDEFRASMDAVVFSGPDALSCDAGVRRLRQLGGPELLTTAGPVANSMLGIAEVEASTSVRCLSGEMILGGALVPPLRALRERVAHRTSSNGAAPHAGTEREAHAPMAGASRAAL